MARGASVDRGRRQDRRLADRGRPAGMARNPGNRMPNPQRKHASQPGKRPARRTAGFSELRRQGTGVTLAPAARGRNGLEGGFQFPSEAGSRGSGLPRSSRLLLGSAPTPAAAGAAGSPGSCRRRRSNDLGRNGVSPSRPRGGVALFGFPFDTEPQGVYRLRRSPTTSPTACTVAPLAARDGRAPLGRAGEYFLRTASSAGPGRDPSGLGDQAPAAAW